MATASVVFADQPTLADARFGTDPMNAVWHLVAQSDLHRKWAVSEIVRLFQPPLDIGSYKIYWNRNGYPLGIATWAELPLCVIEDLVENRFRMEPIHWYGTRHWSAYPTLHPMILDMIALHGTCQMIVNDLREVFRGQTVFAKRRNHGKPRLATFRGYDDVAIRTA